jgi:hypothetical protein
MPQKISTIKNWEYALRICKYPQIPEFNTENFVTTAYRGLSIYRLSSSRKGLRALAQHGTSALRLFKVARSIVENG